MRSKFKWIFTLLVALSMQFSFAQEKTVSGVVSDKDGPLPGANVVVKGTTRGVATDVDGKYAIKTKVGETLVFSFVGLADKSVVVGVSNTINATLAAGATNLDEVLIQTGVGTVKRRDAITSATSVVKAKEIAQAGSPSVVQGLVGKVSGLQINTTSNSVNASSSIVINGPRSITGNNQALVVIDNAISTIGVLNSIPPDIIEDVTVLKGAQGAAIYGERGVNGVIIVITKKGSASGKLTFDVNSSIDFQEYAYLPERQTRYGQGWFGEHISIENGAWGAEMDGSLQPVGLPQPDGSFITSPYRAINDNIGKFFQNGTILQNGVSISGGTLNDGYALFSVNRQDREFIVKGDELNRTNFLFKAGKQFGKWFVEGNVQYFTQKQRNTSAALYSDLLQTATNIPVDQFSAGNPNNHWTVYYNSPYWRRDNARNISGSDFFSGLSTVKYNFNKNISARWLANVRMSNGFGTSYNKGFDIEDDVYNATTNRVVLSNFFDSTTSARNIYNDVIVSFDYDLTDNLSLKADVGNNITDNYNRINQVGGTNLDVDGWYNNQNVLEPAVASTLNNNYFRSRTTSYFGTVDLGYKDYLFFNATARNDWTSVLAPGNRSYFYPAFGLSFIPTKAFEAMKGDVLNYAKFTLGWTKSGNSSAVGAYAIDQIGVTPTGFPFGDLPSYIFNTSPTDALIKPEFVTTKELGFSLGFFKDRLTLDGQFYLQNTDNLITTATASSASGIGSSQTNVGELETKGFNIDLGFTPIKGKNPDDFMWQGRVNLSHYKTIVNKVSEDSDEVNLQSTALVGVFATVGEEFPLIKGIGYQRDDAGNVIVDASSGTPLLTSEFIKLGKSNPDYILGLTNSFSYKGLKFTTVCDYRTGHQFYSEVRSQLAWTGHLIESAENGRTGGFIFPNSVYESAPGVYSPNTSIVTGGNSYQSYQTYFSDDHSFNNAENNVLDATAFKVREMALSYTLPESFNKRTGLTSFTFGINARNPFMVLPKENRNYADPETSNTTGNAQGLANVGQYPYTRTYGFTLNVKF